ncbi:class I SAM-dependent methyltransferase [Aurantiacibacter sediminis]|uniref:Methyltransferase domain-containing protein n=1 Tax=Aurantiacibacter sediminis TaxID=2793064 RepID=A0ABS0N351_9SPHN|nr:methyltransferase domain-containing protein [Aurantiacibacter sediminis]MBH5322387.1 methyltransferase domain-containing protein [Aurantiacibacter sediminis]
MTGKEDSEAWNTFWERQDRGGQSQEGTGCLPSGWQGIADTQKRVWQSFTRSLPKGAKILDLATGGGVVLQQIKEKRRDLDLTGVDRATALPDAPKGVTLRGGVDIADLPFPDDDFAAITSQFGFEYGDIEAGAREAARVLSPGGKLGLITHRLSGPIVAHNRKRRDQIAWAIEENELLAIARKSLGLRDAGIAAIPQAIVEAPRRGIAAHGEKSAAWEIAEAIRQTLHFGRNDTPDQVLAVLDDIEAQARNELGRIASLERASAVASDGDQFAKVLEDAGFVYNQEAMLTDGRSPDPFATFHVYTLSS